MKAKFLVLVALVLGLASCQTNFIDGVEVDANGEAAVTLQVGLPEDVTRAVSNANSGIGAIGNLNLDAEWDIRYILEVYDSNGTLAKKRMINREDVSEQTTFSLRLIPGRQYRFVVWADFIPQGQDPKLDYHYNTNDLHCILLNNAGQLNDESRDAYTGYVDVDNFKSSSSISLILKRPFAKLRVVTTDMAHLYTQLVSSKVVYTSKIYTQFNAYTSKKIEGSEISGLEKVVNYSEYDYSETGDKTLFADYFFGSENDVVQFTLDVKDNTTYTIPQVVFNTSIPVERNHLTTVRGNILTDANDITVTIEEDFDGEKEWPTTMAEQLAYAAMFGGEVTLNGMVTLKEGLHVRKPMTLNLNGQQLHYKGNDVLFRVEEGASLTINGTAVGGGIYTNAENPEASKANGYIALVQDGCSLTFNGGTYKVNSCTIAQANGGNIYVKDGIFEAQPYEVSPGVKDHRYTFNHSDSMKNVGKIVVTGGMFYKWNPAESHSENPAMSFIPADYCSYPNTSFYYEVMTWDVAKDKTFNTASNRDQAFELLRAVFRHGGKVNIKEHHSYGDTTDVYLTEALIAETRDVTITGGGEIGIKSGVASIYEPSVVSALICAKNDVTVKFDNYSGNVTSNGEDYAIETRGGHIVVNSGNFKGAVSAAYALEGTITIYGGKFYEIANTTYGAQYLLNCHDANYNDNRKANIVVKGGTFVGFDPNNNTAEGPNTDFVPEGYKSVQSGTEYTVSQN